MSALLFSGNLLFFAVNAAVWLHNRKRSRDLQTKAREVAEVATMVADHYRQVRECADEVQKQADANTEAAAGLALVISRTARASA